MSKQKLLMLLAVVMALILAVGSASAAALVHDEAVEVWSDVTKGTFNVSVFPGKASYSGKSGEVSGIFGNGTVKDYRFFSTANDAMSSYVDGGAGIVAPVVSPSGDTVAGNQNWADVWTATDPGGEFASAADFTDPTVAQAQNITGTIDVSDLKSGTVYAIYGTYVNTLTVTMTMSGAGQTDVVAEYTVAHNADNLNRMWISNFDFDVTEGYDTITYTYTNADIDASRARFMGVIVTGLSYDEVEIIYPEYGEVVPPGDVTLEWINIDPNANDAAATYVDVWFGTEPNKIDGDYTKVVSGQDISSYTITPPGSGVFYWQVDSYLNGKPISAGGTVDYSTGDPCMVEGIVYGFTNDGPIASVDAGPDMVTWSGEIVNLAAVADDDGGSALTYAWTTSTLPAGVTAVFDPSADVAAPSVTITKAPYYTNANIINAGFEAETLGEDGWGGSPGWTQIGRMGNWNPPDDAYDGSAVPEGVMCAWAQTNDGGLAQVLTETLVADNDYSLTVEVGNSNRYDWTGYKVQLLAGGSVIAEDNSSLQPALGTFETSIVNYSYAPEDANKVGLPLEIRLLAGGLAAGYAECNFDAVQLTADPPFPAVAGVVTVDVTATVNDVLNPAVSDTMTIDVYGDACQAAREGLGLDIKTDYNGNCSVNPEDLAKLAAMWLEDTSATDYVVEVPDVSLSVSGQLGILDLTANGGINPNTGVAWAVGDQYRLAFYTDGKTGAASNDPADYNNFVTAEAQLNPALAGSTWLALVSVNLDGTTTQALSAKIDAKTNSGTDDISEGAGVPVYAMDGATCIAKNNADIWNGWSNPFDGDAVIRIPAGTGVATQNVHYAPFLNQYGLGDSGDVHGVECATGSKKDGTYNDGLGTTTDNTKYNWGNTNANNADRVWARFGNGDTTTGTRSLYAVSEVLTVITPLVDAGDKVSTWLGKEIAMDPIVGDPNDPTAVFDYSWTAYPADDPTLDIAISNPSIEAPTVTISKVPSLKPFVPNGSFENVVPQQYILTSRDFWGHYDRPPGTGYALQYAPNSTYHFPEDENTPPDGDVICRTATPGNDGQSRPDGLAMILDAKFDPSATYELSVAVGHPFAAESPYPSYNENTWRGYRVQLVVGGEVESIGSGADNIFGGTVIAEDDNSIDIAPRTWETSIVTCAANSASTDLAGLPLQIRLLALDYEDPADPNSTKVFYDDVKLLINGEAGTYVTDPGMRSVNMILAVNKQGESETASDTVVVDVYDDGCALAKALDPSTIAVTDHNVDCITDIGDFADLAADWLWDYALTEPQAKPE